MNVRSSRHRVRGYVVIMVVIERVEELRRQREGERPRDGVGEHNALRG